LVPGIVPSNPKSADEFKRTAMFYLAMFPNNDHRTHMLDELLDLAGYPLPDYRKARTTDASLLTSSPRSWQTVAPSAIADPMLRWMATSNMEALPLLSRRDRGGSRPTATVAGQCDDCATER
jgi:hypothetical protein